MGYGLFLNSRVLGGAQKWLTGGLYNVHENSECDPSSLPNFDLRKNQPNCLQLSCKVNLIASL